VRVVETGTRLGFITPLTNNFCEGCNRVRLTASGQLYTCLGHEDKMDLRGVLRSDGPAALNAAIDAALLAKPLRHAFQIAEHDAPPAVQRHMSVTGG
jgi:cyclic pyranopterin phosphate synthase